MRSKRLLATLLTLTMVVSGVPSAAIAAETEAPAQAEEQQYNDVEAQDSVEDGEAADITEVPAEEVKEEAPVQETKKTKPGKPSKKEGKGPRKEAVQDEMPEQAEEQKATPSVALENKKEEVNVYVDAPEGALYEDTELKVEAAPQSAIDALQAEYGKDAVIQAVDISFVGEDGEYEPMDAVNVKLESEIFAEASDYIIVHIKDDGTIEEIGKVTEVKNEDAVEFVSDQFSVYAIVWTESNVDHTATVTWGYMDGSSFKELEEGSTVTLDTTASTVSLENTYEGYYMIGATYRASSTADWVDVSPARLTKNDNGWQITTITHNSDDTTTANTIQVADGSEIRVIYGPKTSPTPSGAGDATVPSPTTEKTVTDNGDGTYTIQLDVTGTEVTETTKVGANVLIVFDRTQSMSFSMPGADNRMAAAKSAVATLVNTLSTGENAQNDIDYSLVTFYRQADSIHTWGTDAISGRTTWTKNATAFNTYVQNIGYPSQNGTNWEAGLYQARQALNSKDGDTTYVIFLTDGEPNRRGTGSNTYSANTTDAISYALTQAQAITGTANVKLYGVFCGSDSGYNNLNNMINNAGGVKTINGTDNATLQSEFAAIAQTIVDNLGAGDYALDDGVPSLAGISANVTGEAGGYEYYKKGPNDADFSEWSDAPGALYSNDNGVTWDLSSVGTLPAGTTYRIVFTVWPSQAAYDLIADLNNGLKDYDDLSDKEKAAVTGSKETGYTLVTNTHLNTTYTFNGTEYSDAPEPQYKAMPLPTKTISVEKLWPTNALDGYGVATYRDENGNVQTATEITLNLQKDKADYLPVTVKASEGWKKNDIYVSCGNMVVKNGEVEIHEPGHDYQIVEPAAFSYYWDLISDVYHPMVINGTATLLVLDEKATSANNVNSFEINGKIYVKHADNDNTLKASNYRRSNLNLTKVVSTEGGQDGYFTYAVTVNDANSTDGKVWFSAWDPEAGDTVKTPDWVISGASAQAGNTGYWYADNGATITLKIKAGWNVRFLNLYHGSTFSFEETDMPLYYEFEKAEAEKQYDFMDTEITDADWYKVTGEKVEGKIIEPNNSYTVTYTNKYKAFYIYHSSVAGDGGLEVIPMSAVNEDGTYDLYAKTKTGTLYGGYYLDYAGKGDYKDDGIKGTTGVVYSGMNYDWAAAQAQTVIGTAMKPEAGETYYIKEVPTYYLRNYHQINYMKTGGELKALYLISAVDDCNYQQTGVTLTNGDQTSKVVSKMTFRNYSTNKSVTLKANTVFKSIGITQEGEYLTYYDATGSSYFAVGSFTVLPYWITLDGIEINGISTRTITITEMTKAGISKSDS